MAAQQGFQYEINASNALKPVGFVPAGFVPAGAGHNQPDLVIVKNKQESGCELKITDASAGSLVLKYDTRVKKWGFDPKSRQDPEKAFLMDVAESVKLFDLINSKWTEMPYKLDRENTTPQIKTIIDNIPLQQRYERDLKTFPELGGKLPPTEIEKYYNRKDTYYVNIGTHGFYLFGDSNPLKFSNVPKFSNNSDAGWRARVQNKGGGNYQFTFEMSFKMRVKSPYNIAPITRTSVAIQTNAIKLPV